MKEIFCSSFRKSSIKIMKSFVNEYFNLHNAQNNREFCEYVQKIIRLDKFVEL